MYVSKTYEDTNKKVVFKRNPVHSIILPSVDEMVLDGDTYKIVKPDHFLGIGKAFKKIGAKLKKKSNEFKELGNNPNLPAALKVYSLAGEKSTKMLGDITTDFGAPIGSIVDYGGSAVLLGSGISALAPLASKGYSLAKDAIIANKDTIIKKGKELAISKGKDLAVDIIKNKLAGGSSYSIDEKPDTSLMYNQSGNDNTLAAGTPINFANPWLLIGVIIFFIILVAIKKMR